ncbi:hydroxyisourate hydrolase [Dactylosporangium sp. NPDC048998]|uniref:hydroxyisourate hydrolase n=1 Tax=Dactylosporangium sp. NPDC048998 TaxID=3363976 RepID=UPI0037195860
MSLSTHVLDTARGIPAAGVPIRLETADHIFIGEGQTDLDGRLRWEDVGTGRYRMVIDTAAYLGPDAFFPEVAITFTIADACHHHVPLLLSPFGYSTYRGS